MRICMMFFYIVAFVSRSCAPVGSELALICTATHPVESRDFLSGSVEAMGHHQPPTPMQTDNSTPLGVVTKKIQPKRTKAMDIRFHCLRCRANQRQLRTYWCAGPTKKVDYVTKHHAASHHKNDRADYLIPTNRFEELRHHIQARITELASRVTDVARASFTKSSARVC